MSLLQEICIEDSHLLYGRSVKEEMQLVKLTTLMDIQTCNLLEKVKVMSEIEISSDITFFDNLFSIGIVFAMIIEEKRFLEEDIEREQMCYAFY